MAKQYEEILDQVRQLLEDGKSLAITTIDTPWGSGDPSPLNDALGADFAENSIFKSEAGRRCVQWVVLPSGQVKCARYSKE